MAFPPWFSLQENPWGCSQLEAMPRPKKRPWHMMGSQSASIDFAFPAQGWTNFATFCRFLTAKTGPSSDCKVNRGQKWSLFSAVIHLMCPAMIVLWWVRWRGRRGSGNAARVQGPGLREVTPPEAGKLPLQYITGSIYSAPRLNGPRINGYPA